MPWWIAATVCAYFVKGLCGFANTLIFTTMLSFGHSNVSISPVELLLGYPTNLILVWRERRSIRWSICTPLAVLVILGCIPGALFLKNADSGIIKIIFGVVIILLSLEMLLRELRPGTLRQSRLALTIIG
ncbi:MAG: sulfite exporter TauE/SafE family protein, partial [Aristaeellaceae bacterium]